MKHLLIAPILLTLLLASCSTKKKYNSYREAVDACKEWIDKGGTYNLINPEVSSGEGEFKVIVNIKQNYKIPLRWCEEEMVTNQILGFRIPEEIKKDSNRVLKQRCYETIRRCDVQSVWQRNNIKVKANFYY